MPLISPNILHYTAKSTDNAKLMICMQNNKNSPILSSEYGLLRCVDGTHPFLAWCNQVQAPRVWNRTFHQFTEVLLAIIETRM